MAPRMALLPAPGNRLLAQLPREEYERLSSQLDPVSFAVNDVLYESNTSMRYAFFPNQGLISVISQMEDGRVIEVGTIGRDGVSGGCVVLDVDRTPYRQFIQVAGDGLRIGSGALVEAMPHCPVLHRLLLRYQMAFHTQTMQAAACNGLHSVKQRCCRWLLMTADRLESDNLPLTHEFLGLMLGVRRASVSDVLRPLQQQGLIRSQGGVITVADREGLEAATCECYWIIANESKRLLEQ